MTEWVGALDRQLNDKFGLPPVGLPPKKWFGLEDAELIQMRHKVLLAYVQDCLKRPVLIHSRSVIPTLMSLFPTSADPLLGGSSPK